METLLFDLRVALRSLRKSPTFAGVAVGVFALGVGAAVAVFGIVVSVVFRPLGYPDEARLVAVTSLHQSEALEERGNFLPDFWFWRRESRSFDAIAFYGWRSMTLDEPGMVQSLQSVAVSANLFHLLGIDPVLGRALQTDDETPGRGNVALVSYSFWNRVLGGTKDAVGRTLRIDGRPVTIVGVMPQGTNVPSPEAELWLPVGEFGYQNTEFDREERDFRVIARLRERVSLAEAGGEMMALSETLASLYPETNASWRASVRPLSELVVGRARTPLFVALGAVAVVFLIACSNIAHLFLIRSVRRSREIAMRRALGAGGARLAQQQIAEALVVTAAGGASGLLVAEWLTRLILFYEPGILPRKEAIALGPEALLFALVVTLAAGVLFGLLSLARFHDLPAALRAGTAGSGDSRSHNRWRGALVGGQLALALTLLVGAGLLTRALYVLSRVDPGFRPEGTYSAHVLLDPGRYREPERRRVYFRRLVEAVRAMPGVEAAALTTTPPVPGMGIQIQVPYRGFEGPLVTEADAPRAALRVVSPGYFAAIGIPLERGRDFDARDDENAPDVVVVSETLGRSAFPGEDPVGKRLTVSAYGQIADLEIVGVSADTRFAGLDEAARPELFVPHAQLAFRGMAIVARTSLPPATFADQLKKTVLSLDSSQPLMSVDSLEVSLARTLALERFYSLLLGLFSGTAILLAASGIYGVFAYWVSERKREMGLRIALGARPGDVVRIVVGRGVRLTGLGLVIGLATSLLLARTLVGTFHGIDPMDPLVLGSSLALLGIVAIVASYLPAREAARVDPMTVLRSE